MDVYCVCEKSGMEIQENLSLLVTVLIMDYDILFVHESKESFAKNIQDNVVRVLIAAPILF